MDRLPLSMPYPAADSLPIAASPPPPLPVNNTGIHHLKPTYLSLLILLSWKINFCVTNFRLTSDI